MRAVLGFALPALTALTALFVLPACSAEEKICPDGEVAIERDGGGRSCADPDADDEDCPAGQILLKNPDAGVEGCIENEYSPDSYTDRLTSKKAG
jgi:hypothetical protein